MVPVRGHEKGIGFGGPRSPSPRAGPLPLLLLPAPPSSRLSNQGAPRLARSDVVLFFPQSGPPHPCERASLPQGLSPPQPPAASAIQPLIIASFSTGDCPASGYLRTSPLNKWSFNFLPGRAEGEGADHLVIHIVLPRDSFCWLAAPGEDGVKRGRGGAVGGAREREHEWPCGAPMSRTSGGSYPAHLLSSFM